jgi:alpha-ketoglutaric semialdehyde dehydrogenase
MKMQHESLTGSDTGRNATFSSINPATGKSFGREFRSSTLEDVDRAARLAEQAFATYGKLSGKEKGKFLRQIASGMEAVKEDFIECAHMESALPVNRLQGETARTVNQLRLFADLVEEGSWPMPRIDTANPSRTPLPKPDIRSMLRPLGPVAVFGASNFPLAFSVAGGDTASALAAGNPVIVKAHPSHPGTSEIVAKLITQCVRDHGLPAGTFSLLFDAGHEIGTTLVQHPLVKAVGFTGSQAGGKTLMQLAASRPEPIPCFAEMGSTNPIFIFPDALGTRGEKIATALFDSFTAGVGQMCTKPGMVFLPHAAGEEVFLEKLQQLISRAPAGLMLNANICSSYGTSTAKREHQSGVRVLAKGNASSAQDGFSASPVLYAATAEAWLKDKSLAAEIFGPTTLLVYYDDPAQLMDIARELEGHLTASVHVTEGDLANAGDLIAQLERKAGRLIFNGFPTGVEVCHSMIHGGPYPATSDGRSTSVGTQAIFRFTRPVCFQGFPQNALPAELQDSNPLGILRMVNGEFTRSKVECY